MNQKLKSIIEQAIKTEDFFMEFYKNAAAQTSIESVKSVLLRLGDMEAGHKSKLEKLNLEGISGSLIPEKIDAMELHEDLQLTPVDEFEGLRKVMKYAIKSEIEANKTYTELSEAIEEPEVKKMFEFLAKEEEGHRKLLTIEMENLGL